jgi:hypothetical protein
MSFLNNLIYAYNSGSIAERIEAKRQIFGVNDELITNKFAFGYFLDGDFPLEQQNNVEKLKRYEFFAPSLSCQKLVKELKAFFQSAGFMQLHTETQKLLKEAADILEKTQDITFRIDDIRSADLRQIFLTLTGKGFSLLGDQEFDPEKRDEMIAKALEQVVSLSIGEQGVFSAGNIVHETLLSVEKIDDNQFKVQYYNTADHANPKRKYFVSGSFLLGEAFWKDLYSSKFMRREKLLFKQFNELDPVDKNDRDISARFRQRKNTCHLRCFLSFLKDQVVQRSPLPIQDSYCEWTLFKEQFGQFLLSSGQMTHEEMSRLSQQKQLKRSSKSRRVIDFQACAQQGKAEETLTAYRTLFRQLTGDWISSENSKNPIFDLIQAEKTLLKAMESCLLLPEDLDPLFEKNPNPWVQQTLQHFKERFPKRQSDFQKGLKEELEQSSKVHYEFLNQLQRSTLECLNEATHKLSELPFLSLNTLHLTESRKTSSNVLIEKAELQNLLNLFENSPERLHFLGQKPHCLALITQAIKMGMIEQVDRIYQKLPQKEQEEILTACREKEVFSYPVLPRAVYDYILQQPDSALSKCLSKWVCLDALRNGQRLEFLNVIDAMKVSEPDLAGNLHTNELHDFHAGIPQEEILPILSLLDSYFQTVKTNYPSRILESLISSIGKSLLKHKDTQLAAEYHIPEWKEFLDFVHLYRLYQNGEFKELSSKQKATPYSIEAHFQFDNENYKNGLDLLKKIFPASFLFILFQDLVTFAFQQGDVKAALEVLHCYGRNPFSQCADYCWRLDYSLFLFMAQGLVKEEAREDEKNVFMVIKYLIDNCDSKERFEQISGIIESLCLQYPSIGNRLTETRTHKVRDYIGASAQGFLAKATRKDKCGHAFMELVNDWGYRDGETFSNYRKECNTFLSNWKLLVQNEDLSDWRRAYRDFIQPIFGMHVYGNRSHIDALGLLKSMSFAENVRLPLAVLFRAADENRKENKEQRALMIFPDQEKLNEAYVSLTSKN